VSSGLHWGRGVTSGTQAVCALVVVCTFLPVPVGLKEHAGFQTGLKQEP
jgi:hypothetical protein